MKRRMMWGLFVCIGLLALSMTQNVQTASAETTEPLLVKDIDSAARQPFQVAVNWANDPTQMGGGGSFTVPAGKRLVMEQISCAVGLVQGDAMNLSISTFAGGSYAVHRFIVNQSPIGGGDYSKYWFVDRLVRIYADPGTVVNVSVGNNLGGAGAGWSTVSGYLVDISQ